MRHADAAKLDHERLFNCAQAMLGAYAEELGLDRAQALKVATGFGGGMGRMGGTCGVITGAYMVLTDIQRVGVFRGALAIGAVVLGLAAFIFGSITIINFGLAM